MSIRSDWTVPANARHGRDLLSRPRDLHEAFGFVRVCDIFAVGFRLLWLGLLGLLGAALLIGHFVPQPAVSVPSGAQADRLRLALDRNTPTVVPPIYAGPGDCVARLLDPETGRLKPLDLPTKVWLTSASLSPWRDELGREQMVVSGFDHASGQIILARYALPSGRVLDRIPIGAPVVVPPCWNPRVPGQILFVAATGWLYRAEFADGVAPKVQPVRWGVRPPGEGSVMITTLSWPNSQRLDGRILVSLWYRVRIGAGMSFTPARLWWLKLDRDGSSIIGAGPLDRSEVDPRNTARRVEQERYPVLVTARNGARAVVYLVNHGGGGKNELRIAPLDIDPVDGTPHVTAARGVSLADGCANAAPALSADGRWVTCLIRANGAPATPATVWHGDLDRILEPILSSVNSPETAAVLGRQD